jgi:hypothetical protein
MRADSHQRRSRRGGRHAAQTPLARQARRWIFALAIFSLPILAVAQSPAPVAAPAPLVRSAAELQMRLQARTSVSLTGSQLRHAANELARKDDLGLAIDRRVDPETPVELAFADAPSEEVWRKLAESCNLGFATFGPMIYLGPTPAARDLNTLAALRRDDAGRASPALKAKLLQSSETSCSAPCDARALWNTLAAEAGLTTTNPERMPFDVWPEVRWGSLPLVDRVTLVAVQFGLTFKLDPSARTVTFEPLPSDVALERSYAAGAKPQETLARIAAAAPTAIVRQNGAKITVVGKFEDQERIAAVLNGAPNSVGPSSVGPNGVAQTGTTQPNRNAPPAAGVQVYTLRIEDKPFSEMVRVLQEKHGLKIKVHEEAIRAAGISLDQRVNFTVSKVTLLQLLEKAAAPLKLTARQVGDTVEITVPAAAAR